MRALEEPLGLGPPAPGSRLDCRPIGDRRARPVLCARCGRPEHLWRACDGSPVELVETLELFS